MKTTLKSLLSSGRWQLNAIGAGLLALLGLAAWGLTHPLTPLNLPPLAFIGYAAWRILFELTWNRAHVPTLATSLRGRAKITEILKAETARRGNAGMRVIDLGSGRGELARRIAKAIPLVQVLGIEQARIPHRQSVWIQRLFGPANLSFESLDFWTYDCAAADAVLLYLNQRLAVQVGEKLARELPAGGMVISHTFPLRGGWTPIETVEFRTPFKETIYVYRKP